MIGSIVHTYVRYNNNFKTFKIWKLMVYSNLIWLLTILIPSNLVLLIASLIFIPVAFHYFVINKIKIVYIDFKKLLAVSLMAIYLFFTKLGFLTKLLFDYNLTYEISYIYSVIMLIGLLVLYSQESNIKKKGNKREGEDLEFRKK